jgi:hypothetical protein
MAITKTEAIKQLESAGSSVAHQQALVKKLAGTQLQKQIKHIIPGGKHLTEQVSKEALADTIFTWLRRVRFFKDVTLSMCKDNTKLTLNSAQVVDFDSKSPQLEWDVKGKKWLAERMADVLKEDKIVAVTATKTGLTAYQLVGEDFTPAHDLWEPNLTFTPFKPGF